jgi:hypothetical protein
VVVAWVVVEVSKVLAVAAVHRTVEDEVENNQIDVIKASLEIVHSEPLIMINLTFLMFAKESRQIRSVLLSFNECHLNRFQMRLCWKRISLVADC